MHLFDLDTVSAGLPAASLVTRLRDLTVGAGMRVVVEAPPGSGKTTVVPPVVAEILAEAGAGSGADRPGRIVVAQPRRMAARAAARRLAQLSGTHLGEEVGFTVRGEHRTSARTRVEFVTTGVLVRRLLGDPELDGVDAVVLDEVHERHLDTDLAFAMCRELADLRDDLSLIVMSATLDAEAWSARLGSGSGAADVLSVPGEIHPLDTVWAPAPARGLDARGVTWAFLDHIAATTVRALAEIPTGDVLVFVPGAREVAEVAARVERSLGGHGAESAGSGPAGTRRVTVQALMGRTSAKEQDAILRPHSGGADRRVIVSTAVAESALTVPGVSIVVDSGLARGPRLDTRRGMSGLVTMRESKASGTQRGGRAARLGPGTVYRCQSEADWAALPEHTPAEIATSDLTSAVLDLAVWGGDLSLLPDPLPTAPRRLAIENLVGLGAFERADDSSDRGTGLGAVTPLGRAIARIPASPWTARGLLDGAEMIGPRAAAEAIALVESDAHAPGGDLAALLRQVRRDHDRGIERETARLEKLARSAARGASDAGGTGGSAGAIGSAGDARGARLSGSDLGLVVALSFPDRIARLRDGSATEYLLASGTAAELPRDSSLAGTPWLAIAEVALASGRALIRSAAVLDEDTAELAGDGLVVTEEEATFTGGKVRAVRTRRLGAIELSSTPIRAGRDLARRAVAESVARTGAKEVLDPSESFESLRRRLGFVHHVLGDPWPDVRWPHLAATLDEWAPEALDRIARGSSPRAVDLVGALRTLLPWPAATRLDELVPEAIEVPTGSHVRLTYPDPDLFDDAGDDRDDVELKPVLAVKLQECFGWTDAPRICDGRAPIVLHLLSPARRPLAVTGDLASFWSGAYAQVRAENRGRYPKHPWPEDPLTAVPQRGVKNPKPRGSR